MASTADAQLVVATTSFVSDLPFVRDKGGERSGWLRRVLIIGTLGVIAALFAATENRVIFTFVLYAWSALGASFGPAILYVLHVKNRFPAAILFGILTGLLSSILLANSPYHLAGSFFISCATIVIIHFAAIKLFRKDHIK
jgi:sodium/proline symporter